LQRKITKSKQKNSLEIFRYNKIYFRIRVENSL